jgi:hypothetical protein
MPALVFPEVESLEAITAADLNDTFAELATTGLDRDNLSSTAIDMAQLTKTLSKGTRMEQHEIGVSDWQPHYATPGLINSTTGATVGNGTAPSDCQVAINGTTGFLISTTDVVEVTVTLMVNPVKAAITTPPAYQNSFGYRQFYPDTGTTTHNGHDNATLWAAWLEWDITSSALSNFTPVPGQARFNTAIDYEVGCPMANMSATGIIPAFLVYHTKLKHRAGFHATDEGTEKNINYIPLSIRWIRPAGASLQVRVYGFRLAFAGMVHPYNDGTDNWLVMDDGMQASNYFLNYLQGSLMVKIMESA